MKRPPKKFLIPLMVGLAVGGIFIWRAFSDDRRALEELQAEVAETKAEFPELNDLRGLATARVRGTNGWLDVLKAFDLAESIRNRTVTVPLPDGKTFEDRGKDLLSTLYPHGEDDDHRHPELFEPPEGPARITLALKLTEPMAEHFRRAAEAQSIVLILTTRDISIFRLLDSWKLMGARIVTLLDAGRAAQARDELMTLLNVAARTRTDSLMIQAYVGAVVRHRVISEVLLPNLERLPMAQPLLEEAIRLLSGRQPSIRHIYEGNLAYALERIGEVEDLDQTLESVTGLKRPGLLTDPKKFFRFKDDWRGNPVILAEVLKDWVRGLHMQVRELRKRNADPRDATDLERIEAAGRVPGAREFDFWDDSDLSWKIAMGVLMQDLLVLECELRLLELRNGKLVGQKAAVAAAAAKVKGARLKWDGETVQLWFDDDYEIIRKAEETGAEEPYRELYPLGSAD